MNDLGHTRWAIPEGYIPEWSNGPAPEMQSHEAVCILNAGDKDADVTIDIYFENREPAGPFHFKVGARRTSHLRFNEFQIPEAIPPGIPYSSVIRSSVPVVVQHTRLDSRQAANALISTVAFPG